MKIDHPKLKREIRSFLKEQGLRDQNWQREISEWAVSDIHYLMSEGASFEEAKRAILDGIDPEKLIVLKLNYPIDKMHLVYNYLARGFSYLAVLMVLAALVFLFLGSPAAILLGLSALGVFTFFVIPFRVLRRTRIERIERIYRKLFKTVAD